MSSRLYQMDDPRDVAEALKNGRAALFPWEWLPEDYAPADWAQKIATFATILGVNIDIKPVPDYRLTIAVNTACAPPLENLAQAMAELQKYRDHDLSMPTRHMMLLANQHRPG